MYPVFFIVTKLTFYMQHLVHVYGYTRFIIMLPRWNAYKPRHRGSFMHQNSHQHVNSTQSQHTNTFIHDDEVRCILYRKRIDRTLTESPPGVFLPCVSRLPPVSFYRDTSPRSF